MGNNGPQRRSKKGVQNIDLVPTSRQNVHTLQEFANVAMLTKP